MSESWSPVSCARCDAAALLPEAVCGLRSDPELSLQQSRLISVFLSWDLAIPLTPFAQKALWYP